MKNIILDPVRGIRTTRSSTHSHPFQVTLPNQRTLAHKSSFIPRTSQLWNSLPPTTTICHLLKLTSTNLILSLFLLNLPIFSVFLLSGFAIGHTAFPRHYVLEKDWCMGSYFPLQNEDKWHKNDFYYAKGHFLTFHNKLFSKVMWGQAPRPQMSL